MIDVSTQWLNNQKRNLTSESHVKITLDMSTPGSDEWTASSDMSQAEWSRIDSINIPDDKKTTRTYATLEHNQWLLDGSLDILPSNSNEIQNGYISEKMSSFASSNHYPFKQIPTIDIIFSQQVQLLPAITIIFDEILNEYASDFVIGFYVNNITTESVSVTNNNLTRCVVHTNVTTCDRISIGIHRWCLEYRRARISSIYMGIRKVFTRKELINYTHTQTNDPIGVIAPTNEVSFSVDNSNDEFHPDNPEGFYDYLAERQEVDVQYGFKLNGEIEYIETGKFYLSEWKTPNTGISTSFVARDIIEFLQDEFYKGKYTYTNLYSLADLLFRSANIPLMKDGTVRWEISNSLKNIYTSSPLPIAPIITCLQLVAQAGMCGLYCRRDGKMIIDKISTNTQDYNITAFNSYNYPESSLQTQLRSVNVKVHYFYPSTTTSELFKGDVKIAGVKKILITYSRPAEVNMNGVIIENGELISAEFNTYTCILEIEAQGTVNITIEGMEIQESTSDYVLDNDAQGEEQIVVNPLIDTVERADAVGKWVKEWLAKRKIINSKFRIDPRLDVLDIINVDNKWQTEKVRTTSVVINYTGAFKGTVRGKVI